MTVDTGKRSDPRVMLARISLMAELPMPRSIRFHGDIGSGVLALTFDRIADGQAWSAYLGGQAGSEVTDGVRYLKASWITWGGWQLHLNASEPVSIDTALDQATTERLHLLVSPEVAA
ncbi:hypothetical protein [Catenuloplanes japonicus]|uniref:hypothetical protein n=1 Tax=Catenuloplanes japonicus TaxID=33876 RepID=UPI000B0BF8F2|nr:hypothetical protein [Catenuloplanes japonicus]